MTDTVGVTTGGGGMATTGAGAPTTIGVAGEAGTGARVIGNDAGGTGPSGRANRRPHSVSV
jgi:hypothetical protein